MIRLLSAVILALAATGAIVWLPLAGFQALVVLLVFLGLRELTTLSGCKRSESFIILILGVFHAAILLDRSQLSAYPTLIVITLFILFLFYLWSKFDLQLIAQRLGFSLFAVLYLGTTLPAWAWIRELPQGRVFLLMAIAAACLTDTFALIFGKTFGKHPFAPHVSPKKTWEGFFGALVGALVGSLFVWWFSFQDAFSPWYAVGFAGLIWMIAPAWDGPRPRKIFPPPTTMPT
ncbi:MAG: phosphatidate cytidylyltransferase [Deltaproteobacteria bacterium]|nr:phosphatidate cytidylyltransferase [Deltaproteobacteria bacterium]